MNDDNPKMVFGKAGQDGAVGPSRQAAPNPVDERLRDRQLFERIHRAIIKGRLYLDPAFSRDSYIKLGLVNKNRVAKIMKLYAGTNLNGYINALRLEYAARLMRERADLPMKAVALDSGFRSLRTFYRLFIKRFGMTPTRYKDEL